MIIFICPLVCLAGLLAYVLSANPKVSEIGRLSFFAGLLATLLTLPAAQHAVHLLG